MLSAISDRTRLLDIFSPDATHEGSFCPSLCRGAGSRPQATPEVSTLTPNTSDPEVMAGTEGLPLCRPLAREGLRATKPPSFTPSRSDPRARRKPEKGALVCSPKNLSGRARMGRYGSILGAVNVPDRHAQGAWTPSRARL